MTTYWSHPLLLQILLFYKLTMCVDDFRHCGGMVYYGDCIFSCDVQYKACITSMHSMSIIKYCITMSFSNPVFINIYCFTRKPLTHPWQLILWYLDCWGRFHHGGYSRGGVGHADTIRKTPCRYTEGGKHLKDIFLFWFVCECKTMLVGKCNIDSVMGD